METPTRRWRRGYERFDRKLGFALGAAVGFALCFLGVAGGLDSTPQSAALSGLVGAVVLGGACALFGDRVLAGLSKLFS